MTLVQRALRAAADRSAWSSSAHAGELAVDRTDYVESIVAYLTSPSERRASQPNAKHSLRREDVDELRTAFLRNLVHVAGSIDGAELLNVLIALESLAHRDEHDERPATPAGSQQDEDGPLTAVTELAHDMRSPLTSILFLVDTILRVHSGPLTSVQERQLKLVYGAAWGLSSLAGDVIDSVRAHGLLDGRPTPFSITETIQSVSEIVRPIAEEKGLSIKIQTPRADGRLGYSSALARVLLNLASNALRYTDEGSVSIGCTERDDQRVTFWVEDTGRGMSDNAATALTAPASRAVNPHFTSTGLGLAICRNLLSAMNSSLAFERMPDGGTRFSFELDLPLA